MDHDLVAALRTALRADQVTLVQPVVRGDVLLLGRRLTATAQGVSEDDRAGQPILDMSGASSRGAMRARFHLDGGGVVGIAPPGVHHRADEGLQPLDTPHLLFDGDQQTPGVAAWLVLDGATLGALHAQGAHITPDACQQAGPALSHLRRRLARRFEALTSTLTGVGRTASPDGAPPDALRPVRAPIAPVGLLLTSPERQVARQLLTSASLADIAAALSCSPTDLAQHSARIYAALGVSRRTEVAQRLREL